MGLISQKYKEAESQYKENHNQRVNSKVGAIQMVRVSSGPDLYVCNMIAQKATGKGAPPIDYNGFESALKELSKEAKEKRLTIHFSKYHSSVPGLDWKKCEDLIKKNIIKKRIKYFNLHKR